MESSYPCPTCGQPVPNLGMAHFSFNKPEGACPACTGLGVVQSGNLDLLIDESKSLVDGGVRRWDIHEIKRYTETFQAAGKHYGFSVDTRIPLGEWDEMPKRLLLYGVNDRRFREAFSGIEAPETVSGGRFEGVVPNLIRRYNEAAGNSAYRAKLGTLLTEQPCPECEGTRLRLESRAVTVAGLTIIDACELSLTALGEWIATLRGQMSGTLAQVAEAALDELSDWTQRLVDVGIGYLHLSQATPSLSGGEAQRLRLAALLGSGLTGVMYILDEPTIGMHPRDTEHLIHVLRKLRDLGNTVLVIEHDMDVMRAADRLVELGPGAGPRGGTLVAEGTPDEVGHSASSITGQYLSGAKHIPIPARRRSGNGQALTIHGATAHNLKHVTVSLPLGKLISVIGVSGSGKSSLMLDVLAAAANRHFHGSSDPVGAHEAISGWEYLDEVIAIDQTPLGRTPRSNAATYTDIFTPIRQVFASQPAASGLDARHFSFNVPGGRCERCEGAGVLTVNMQILADVEVRCPTCQGRRFRDEILQVRYRGLNMAEVLDLSIDEALGVFADVPAVARKLRLLDDVGLGYLKLGQPATMLSGGEAQRVKLAKELGRAARGHILYLLDEPTTGLHPDDTARLLAVLHRLVDARNTVAVIEHNVDVIRASDWVIELGPKGGKAGGELISEGTPDQVAANPRSVTAPYIA